MSWLKKIFSDKKGPPKSPEEVISKLDKIAETISGEVELQVKSMPSILEHFEFNKMMGEREQASALESVYWAITLLRLIQKSEQGWIPQDWVGSLLNDILNEMESEKRGCKVRFARQMLQEYAEILARNPEKSYETEAMLAYFRAWMWESLKQHGASRPVDSELRPYDAVIAPFLNRQDIWD